MLNLIAHSLCALMRLIQITCAAGSAGRQRADGSEPAVMRTQLNSRGHAQHADRRNTSHSIFALYKMERSHPSGELVSLGNIFRRDEDDEAPDVSMQYGTLDVLLR